MEDRGSESAVLNYDVVVWIFDHEESKGLPLCFLNEEVRGLI